MSHPAARAILSFLFTALLAGQLLAAEINLSAAASLREVITALSGSYAKATGEVGFRTNFGASGALAKQIANGAPADIFLSANTEWMDYLKARGLIDKKSISPFAYNVLVFAGRPQSKVGGLQDVAKLERVAIGSPKSVPAGQYAIEALRRSGIEKKLENKLVMARDARECLVYAERGEVDGAFVYKTDVEEAGKGVKILFTVPQELYPRIVYPMGLTAEGVKKASAAAFFRFLQSGGAKSVIARHGFEVK
jgi:molybdate transport system substrate-binding protein